MITPVEYPVEFKGSDKSKGSVNVLKAAGAMGSGTFLSRLLGLVREEVFAFLFGASNFTDAFNVAFRIPNLLRDLFAEGAMSAALVPTFTRVRLEEGDRRAWRVAGLIFRILFLFVGGLSLVGIFFAPQIVNLYAHAFQNIPGKFEITVQMTRIMFPYFPLVALAAAFMGILNSCGKFFVPAFASALFNLTSILVGVGFAALLPRFGVPAIEGMAIGVVLGGLVQAFCQLPLLYRQNYRWSPAEPSDPPWYREPALKKILILMVPSTVGLGATQVNVLVNTILATSQGTGAISWLNYAFRLMQFPIGIFGVSLASASLPKISQQWVNKDIEGCERTLTQSLQYVIAINLIASAGLAFIGGPIIQFLFQYGHFRLEDTQSTALALTAYAVGLTAYSAVKVLVPACYALGDAKIAVISSVLSVICTVALNLLMIKPFGFWGLALGTSIAAVVNSLFLLFQIRSLLRSAGGNLSFLPLFKSLLTYLGAALVMGILCSLTSRFIFDRWIADQALFSVLGKLGVVLVRALKLSLLLVEAGIICMVQAKIFGLEELNKAFAMIKRRIY